MEEISNTQIIREVAATFQSNANALDDLMQEVVSQADILDGGALIGDAGDALATALRDPFRSRVRILIDKLEEIAQDLNTTAQNIDDAVQASGNLFSG